MALSHTFSATGRVDVVTGFFERTAAYVPVSGDRVPNAPRPWPHSSTERGRQRQPVPAAPAKWRWDHER